MKNIGICVNENKDDSFLTTKNIISLVHEMGGSAEIASINKKYDLIISLGGDGTFLSTARLFFSCPIVGINLGNLGFLSEIEKDKIENSIKRIIDDDFYVEERFLLEATINGKTMYALNDMVINRGTITRLINMELSFNGKFIDNYKADGLIISTPTGSTAYSLSAGGPLVEPNLKVVVISPICAHSLHQRPIVVSSDTEIKIKVREEGFMLMADGQDSVIGENTHDIIIKKSNRTIKVVKLNEECFFDIVRTKFNIK